MADEYDYESTEDRHLPRKWKEVYDAFRYFGLPAETKEDRDKINDPEFWKPFDKKLKLRVLKLNPDKNQDNMDIQDEIKEINKHKDSLVNYREGRIEIPGFWRPGEAGPPGEPCKGCPSCSSSAPNYDVRLPPEVRANQARGQQNARSPPVSSGKVPPASSAPRKKHHTSTPGKSNNGTANGTTGGSAPKKNLVDIQANGKTRNPAGKRSSRIPSASGSTPASNVTPTGIIEAPVLGRIILDLGSSSGKKSKEKATRGYLEGRVGGERGGSDDRGRRGSDSAKNQESRTGGAQQDVYVAEPAGRGLGPEVERKKGDDKKKKGKPVLVKHRTGSGKMTVSWK